VTGSPATGGGCARVRLRAMREEDLARVLAINERCFRHPWSADQVRRELATPWSTVLLAASAAAGPEEVLGFAVAWDVHDEVHVLNVAVAPEQRRRGVARALLEEIAGRGRARGARLVTLEVRSTNAGAMALYRALGYREVGLRKGYYAEEGEDAVVMDLALDAGG